MLSFLISVFYSPTNFILYSCPTHCIIISSNRVYHLRSTPDILYITGQTEALDKSVYRIALSLSDYTPLPSCILYSTPVIESTVNHHVTHGQKRQIVSQKCSSSRRGEEDRDNGMRGKRLANGVSCLAFIWPSSFQD